MKLEEAIKFYPSFTQEDIAALTEQPIHVVRRELASAGFELTNKLTTAWRHEILLTTEGLKQAAAAKMHSTTPSIIYYARYKGEHKGHKEPELDHTELVNFIRANYKKMTQEEMAAAKGVSQSLISRLNPFRRENGEIKRKTEGEWLVILEYARKHKNIQQAAKQFGVSRTAIHKRLK